MTFYFFFYFKRLQVFLIFQELEEGRGAVSDIVKASVLLVEIGPVPVRLPVTVPTENGHADGPQHRRCPNDPQVSSEQRTLKAEKDEI